MNLFKAKLLAILLCAPAMSIQNINASYEYENNGSTCVRQFECGCNPLYCGAYSVQFHAGVAPIVWKNRGELDIISCVSNDANPLIVVANEFPKFSKLYRAPWYIGGKIGYDFTDNAEVYLELDYLQAKRKNNTNNEFVVLNPDLGQAFALNLGKYKLFEMYVGARYYTDRFWCNTAFFLGGKIGFTHHKHTSVQYLVNGIVIPVIPTDVCPNGQSGVANNYLFGNSNVVSGGLNFGLDYCWCGNWSFVLTGEVVAAAAPCSRTTAVFANPTPAPLTATGVVFGGFCTELRFPVTVGVRYSF